MKWRVVFTTGHELVGARDELQHRLFLDGYKIDLPENICHDLKKPSRVYFIRPLRNSYSERLMGVILEYSDEGPTIN